MKEQLISFETAKLAKEKGFDLKCNCHWSTYDNNGVLNNFLRIEDNLKRDYNNYNFAYISNKNEELFSAPSQSLLQRWLREKHQINIDVETLGKENSIKYSFDLVYILETLHVKSFKEIFETYEDALEFGLQEALKLIL